MIKQTFMALSILAGALGFAGQSEASQIGMFARQHNFSGMGRAPLQFQIFCLENPGECKSSRTNTVAYSPRIANLLRRVNASVNHQIRPRNESIDVWSVNVRQGDCDDYVMTKRERLLQAGVPASALRIAMVRTNRGIGHAILLVKTSAGEFALDNLRKTIVKRNETGYAYLRVQGSNPMQWTR